jgi:general secretion pathway protein M
VKFDIASLKNLSFNFGGVRERFDRLDAREQKLMLILGGIVGFMFVIAIPVALFAMAASRSKENDAIREVSQAIMDARPQLEIRDAQRQKVLARYARPTPPLAGFLEQVATLHTIEIPESQDRPIVPHGGKRYEERSTKIELQKVGMKNLSLFLEGIETSGFPVRVSGIDLRKRATEQDSWDVSLIVSAYDRKETEKTKSAASAEPTAEGK